MSQYSIRKKKKMIQLAARGKANRNYSTLPRTATMRVCLVVLVSDGAYLVIIMVLGGSQVPDGQDRPRRWYRRIGLLHLVVVLEYILMIFV